MSTHELLCFNTAFFAIGRAKCWHNLLQSETFVGAWQAVLLQAVEMVAGVSGAAGLGAHACPAQLLLSCSVLASFDSATT